MIRRALLIAVTSASVYVMLELVPLAGEVIAALAVAAAAAVWQFLVRGFAWKKLLLLVKVIKPALTAILAKGTAKYFAKGALRRLWRHLHREYERVRATTAAIKGVVALWWHRRVQWYRHLPAVERNLLVLATLPVAVVPLMYVLVTRAVRSFLAYKVGEAVTEKGVHKVTHHPKVRAAAHRAAQTARNVLRTNAQESEGQENSAGKEKPS